MAPDDPRAIAGTRFESSSWRWWPGTESNQRHARCWPLPALAIAPIRECSYISRLKIC